MAKKIFKTKVQLENKTLNEQETEKISYEFYKTNKKLEKDMKSLKFYGNCRVCNDDATGVHFGVSSCEACRKFFKRSIMNHNKYNCVEKKCAIFKRQGLKCNYCKWNACIQAGMSKNIDKMFSFKSPIQKAPKLLQKETNHTKNQENRTEIKEEPIEFEFSQSSSYYYESNQNI
ncbi:unnamed protein product [Brachionus calyciflorus]|uniref:Nuclear receptor domain-containing protein n=1 Tax=Brachionus calyciflorus TaxID=104777 RepID=A0A813S119_9BILA|nr:unnamed protein product [Brachionus calyciflorus]